MLVLRQVVVNHWAKEGFDNSDYYYEKFDEGAWRELTPEDIEDPPWEWLNYMDTWRPLARAMIFTEYGTPKPYDRGAYYDKLDAVLEPLGYKHYIANDAVVIIMVDPYSEEGEAIVAEYWDD
jgi:hypothetical protein